MIEPDVASPYFRRSGKNSYSRLWNMFKKRDQARYRSNDPKQWVSMARMRRRVTRLERWLEWRDKGVNLLTRLQRADLLERARVARFHMARLQAYMVQLDEALEASKPKGQDG